MNGADEVRLYLDTSVIVSLIEGTSDLKSRIWAEVSRFGGDEVTFVCTPLTRLECLVKPLRTADIDLQDLYERYFSASEVRMVEIGTAVWDQATHIRARYGFRVPDALHLATAVTHGCSVIVTRDAQWRRFGEGRVEII